MGSWRAPAALVLLALAAPSSAHADGKPYVDATRGDRPARERTSVQALTKRLGAQAVVDVDAATGTPRVLARLDGTLTGRSSASPRAIADSYVRSHLSDLGLTSADLDTLSAPAATTSPGGVTEVRWAQSVDGIPSADSDLRVNVAGDGRVINVLGSPAHALDLDSTTPSLDAGEAVRVVQDDVGAFKSLPKTAGPAGAAQSTTFRGGSQASLQVMARSGSDRLVWRVFYDAAPDAYYDAIVDARTGEVLKRANMVKSDARGKVWERYPGAPVGGAQVDLPLTTNGWLMNAATTLNGPNVHAFLDPNDDNASNGTTDEVSPQATYTFTSFPQNGCDATHLCSWNGGSTWQTNRNQNAVQAFYFANKFHDHLAAAPIGFDAASGAFEGNSDKVMLHTDDGANIQDVRHIDNANMATPPRGINPRMQMYLFAFDQSDFDNLRRPVFREINGGDDAAIVYHEYTHGLSNRLITDASHAGALNTAQAGAMGEAWSDWYALDYLIDQGLITDSNAVDGQVDMGAYTDALPGSLRSQPADCAVGSTTGNCFGGYTYGDFGKIVGLPEVHFDGEIWLETLWDIRQALGSDASEAIITQGMRLSPPEPSFLDERNAIIQADQALNNGANRNTLWAIFAHRGMGYFAGTLDAGDVSPTANTALPPAPSAPRGSITGRVTNAETGQPLSGVKVGISGLMNGVDALSDTTKADGTYTINGVPAQGSPRLNFMSDGFDPVVRDVQVLAGVTTIRTAILRRDWASTKGGATADSDFTEYANDGCGPEAALDQMLITGWSTNRPANVGDPNPSMIVTLPQGVNVFRFGMDPGNTCTDGPSSGTTVARVETRTQLPCTDGSTWTSQLQESFDPSADFGRLNELPPTQSATGVRCVRLTLLQNNGGGFRDFSEFGVYTTTRPAQPDDPVPTPLPTATPTPRPSVTPVPTATPAPQPQVKPVTFKLPSSGSKGSVALTVTCVAQCTATATLTADKATAKKLKLTTLGKAAKMGKGSLKFTVKLSSKARKALKRRHMKSVTVTLKVSVRLAGKTTTSSKRVKIKL
jgi:Zn-dependent metalloprotease